MKTSALESALKNVLVEDPRPVQVIPKDVIGYLPNPKRLRLLTVFPDGQVMENDPSCRSKGSMFLYPENCHSPEIGGKNLDRLKRAALDEWEGRPFFIRRWRKAGDRTRRVVFVVAFPVSGE